MGWESAGEGSVNPLANRRPERVRPPTGSDEVNNTDMCSGGSRENVNTQTGETCTMKYNKWRDVTNNKHERKCRI